jgi:hypothetical protein
MKIDLEDFNRKAQHIIDTVVKPQVERYEQAKQKETMIEDTNHGYSQGWDDGSQNLEPMRPEVKSYTYDELRTIAYNAYCLAQLGEPTEGKYNLWIQQYKNK